MNLPLSNIIGQEIEKAWQNATSRDSQSGPGAQRKARSSAIAAEHVSRELRAKLEEHTRRHWAMWMDEPVPALNDMTPREASKTEEGRDLLESLLLFYERHQENAQDNIMRPDGSQLRRELNMEG